jgi:Na+/H+ antiporter NhaA
MIHYGPLFGLTRRVPTMAVKNHVRIVFGWLHLYGAALLCGVGLTMSLFIASLAFKQTVVDTLFNDRLGIIVGSLLSGVSGYMVLHFAIRKDVAQET